MIRHRFGGGWTEDKLGRLREYLTAYRKIFVGNVRAQYFITWYVDAFAGTGSRYSREPTDAEETLFDEVYQDVETNGYRDGSARIALGLDSPFDHYLFVEKSKTRVNELKANITDDFPRLLERCRFEVGDANELLKGWCARRDWKKERAVVFLDPYGMQVEWQTVETLAKTRAIDLWYLFPLGLGVARLLRRDGRIDESWQERLDLLLGTVDWRSRFYQMQVKRDLFGDQETTERNAKYRENPRVH